MLRTTFFLPLSLLACAALAAAAELPLDTGKSSLSAEFTQIGVPVSSPFTKFSGRVSYDPARPAEAQAHIDIDMASYDLGDDAYNSEVRKKEWFNTAQFPKASFAALGLKPLGGNAFEASGKLSLKGKLKEMKVPVSLKSEAGATIFDGTVTISRKEFAIGDPEWNEVVEDPVKIKFHIVVPAAR